MLALRTAILAALDPLVNALESFLLRFPDADLAAREQLVLEVTRQIQPALLTLAVQAARQRPPGRCPHCQVWRADTVVRQTPRTVETVCGTLQVPRRRATCRACGGSWLLPDGLTGLAAGVRLSAQLEAWLVEVGSLLPFAPAAALLERLTGIAISRETIRRHAEAAGRALAARQAAEAAETTRLGESVAPVEPAPGQLVVEVDGVMLRYQSGWHEVKVAVVGGWTGERLTAPSYVAVRATPEELRPLLAAESARRGAWDIVGWESPLLGRGLALLRPVAVLGDGAPWIWNLAGEAFGTRTEIVDFYHATEHLSAVATALFADDEAHVRAWAMAQRDQLWTDGVDPILATLSATPGTTSPQRETLRRERGYFQTNQHRMQYPTFRAAGLPIGSGAVESACKLVVQRRMKGPGMRWSDDGAAGMLALCARQATLAVAQQAA
jgi:hypothetical protein